MYAALFYYMGKCGAPRRRVGGRLNGPCSDLGHHGVSCTRTVVASRVVVCWSAVMSPGGLEGAADVDPYGMQWQAWRCPVPARFIVPELLPQRPAWGCTLHFLSKMKKGSPAYPFLVHPTLIHLSAWSQWTSMTTSLELKHERLWQLASLNESNDQWPRNVRSNKFLA
jgi:hypothetical protein